jgi:hypothetical protein
MLVRCALFWVITRRLVVIVYFGLLTLEDGTDTLSRNVGKQLPHDAAYYPRRVHISFSIPVSCLEVLLLFQILFFQDRCNLAICYVLAPVQILFKYLQDGCKRIEVIIY